jgi:hypothetical protein
MDLQIDRLALRLSGLPEADARRLALLVASSLAATDARGPSLTGRLRLDLSARAGEPLEALAQRIAAGVDSALARTS